MLRHLLIFAGVYVALTVFWRKIYDYLFMGTDELKVFISFEKATDLESLLKFILTPYTQHFMPVFKTLFFLEYSLFGPSSAPYHAVSLGLYSISAILLWKFIYHETQDKTTALICTVVYSANSTYYAIISWLFLQQFTLTLIFLIMALLSASRSIREGRSLFLSAAYCMLSSFCISFGAAAWLFTAIYAVFKTRVLPHENRPGLRVLLIKFSPLAVSAAISYISYRLALRIFTNISMGFLVFDPVLIARGTALMYGDIILETVGLYELIELVAEHTGTAVQTLMPAIRAMIFGNFFAFIAFALLLSRKLTKERRAIVFAGLIFMFLSTAITIAGRATYKGYDIYTLTNVVRYKYFPFFSLLVVVAPFIANAGRLFRRALLFLIPPWVLLHSFIFANLYPVNSARVDTINSALEFVEKSMDNPTIRTPGGKVSLSSEPSTGSRLLEDIVFFRGQPMNYVDLLHIFKKPGEVIAKHDGKSFYLREYRTIAPEDIEARPEGILLHMRDKLKLKNSSSIEIYVNRELLQPSPFQHLYLRIKSERPSRGRLGCVLPDGRTHSSEFDIEEGVVYKRYLLPCPSGEKLNMEIEPGDYVIKDIRLYY